MCEFTCNSPWSVYNACYIRLFCYVVKTSCHVIHCSCTYHFILDIPHQMHFVAVALKTCDTLLIWPLWHKSKMLDNPDKMCPWILCTHIPNSRLAQNPDYPCSHTMATSPFCQVLYRVKIQNTRSFVYKEYCIIQCPNLWPTTVHKVALLLVHSWTPSSLGPQLAILSLLLFSCWSGNDQIECKGCR